jgi:hypothetical protein
MAAFSLVERKPLGGPSALLYLFQFYPPAQLPLSWSFDC